MIHALLVLFGIAFLELILLFDLRTEIAGIFGGSREAMRVLASKSMDDDEKESFVRRASLALFRSTAIFAMKFLVVLAILYLVYLLMVTVLPDRRDAFVANLMSLPGIAIMTIATLCYAWARNAVLKKL